MGCVAMCALLEVFLGMPEPSFLLGRLALLCRKMYISFRSVESYRSMSRTKLMKKIPVTQ